VSKNKKVSIIPVILLISSNYFYLFERRDLEHSKKSIEDILVSVNTERVLAAILYIISVNFMINNINCFYYFGTCFH